MSYKTIEYTVYDDKIMPNTLQSGGVAGDDNAVRVKFNLNNITLAADDKVRIEISNGVGGFNSSEHLTVSGGSVYYDLPLDVTSAGGTAVLHLVICRCKDNIEQSVRYSYPAKIYFEDSGCGSISYKQYKQGLSGLALECKSYMDSAQTASDDADSAATAANQCLTGAQISKAAAETAAAAAKASADAAANTVSDHNTAADAHENRFSIIQSQVNEKVPAIYVTESINSHNTADDAHSEKFTNINDRLSYIDTQLSQKVPAAAVVAAIDYHNADTDAHGGIRNTIALLQKYPCYEYNTSGGNMQRFDDVSVIPHNIAIKVHGATDSDGNSVTNPTVRVYGKNLLSTSGWDEKVNMALDYHVIAGVTYTFSIFATYSSKTTGLYGFSLKIQESGNDIVAKGGATINNRISVTFTATESGTLYYNGYNTISCKELQLEIGGTATEYEPYKGEQTASPLITIGEGENFRVETFSAFSPNMTVIASDDNNLISVVDVTYNRDIGKAIAAIS